MRYLELPTIVASELEQLGYDGLVNSAEGCACKLDDLMPCCQPMPDCAAGHLVTMSCELCADGEACDFHIVPAEVAE